MKPSSWCVAAVLLMFALSFDATAMIRPRFDVHRAAWNADQIVVVRVGSTFEVLEMWRGDLAPGDLLEMPGIVSLDKDAYEEKAGSAYKGWHGFGPIGGVYASELPDRRLYLLEGTRAVLFLRNGDTTSRFWKDPDKSGKKPTTPLATLLPERTRCFSRHQFDDEAIPFSIAWMFDQQIIALAQMMNPGPPMPWPLRIWLRKDGDPEYYTEARFKEEIERVLAEREAYDAACAIADPDQRIRAIRPLLDSGTPAPRGAVTKAVAEYAALVAGRARATPDPKAAEAMLLDFVKSEIYVPSPWLFQNLAKSGARAVPAIAYVLDQPQVAWSHMNAISALQTLGAAGVPGAAEELLTRLAMETAFWRENAGTLEPEWLSAASGKHEKRARQLQDHYSLTYHTLEALRKASHPDREKTVRAFVAEWEKVPAPTRRLPGEPEEEQIAGVYHAILDPPPAPTAP